MDYNIDPSPTLRTLEHKLINVSAISQEESKGQYKLANPRNIYTRDSSELFKSIIFT